MSGEEIERTYFERFRGDFTGDLLRLIAEQCKNSTAECFTFYPKEEGFDLLGDVRRAKVESKARLLAEEYPGLTADVRSSRKSGKGNYHTEIRFNNGFLTIHKVQFPSSRVRKAIYRDSYAQKTSYSLFETVQESEPVPEAILYAQLKYGVDKKMPQAMAFAVIDFPDAKGLVVHSLDLLKMEKYRGIPAEFINLTTPENIEDNLNLKIRPDVKRKQNQDKEKAADGKS